VKSVVDALARDCFTHWKSKKNLILKPGGMHQRVNRRSPRMITKMQKCLDEIDENLHRIRMNLIHIALMFGFAVGLLFGLLIWGIML